MATTDAPAFVILADGDVDQICGAKGEAAREAADLRKMGFDVRVKKFATWKEAQDYQDKHEGR